MRETRIRGLDWLDLVPEEDQTWWRSWADTLQELNGLALPRCLFPNEEKMVHSELHTLSDAYEEAVTSAVYIRNVYEDGSAHARLIMSKTKMAQQQTISIPKLELQAVLLVARLAKYVQSKSTVSYTAAGSGQTVHVFGTGSDQLLPTTSHTLDTALERSSL